MVLRGKWKKLGLLALTGALAVGTAWAAANILEVPAGTTNGADFAHGPVAEELAQMVASHRAAQTSKIGRASCRERV